ncbi:Bax inhibitor 1 family protein [[Mycoplasma] testudinis]|uniref:Bax inhibitor-1 family protein n=1 Tax=[Mycoplasma] testudinis TaxID=33924 RepID=UPI000489B9B3|nr:Bax inhibitor-1 family protein [[Mycoplasma] testudinis]
MNSNNPYNQPYGYNSHGPRSYDPTSSNYGSNNYSGGYGQTGKYTFNQAQTKLMTRSFLVTGICFALIFIIAYGLYELLFNYAAVNEGVARFANGLLAIGPILILVSSIMAWFMRPRLTKFGFGFMIFATGFYVLAQAIGFGLLFFAIRLSEFVSDQYHLADIMVLFAIGGLMFIAMALVGRVLSKRASAHLGRFLFFAVIAWIIGTLVFSLGFAFGVNGGNGASSIVMIISSVVSGVIYLLYIAYIVSQMRRQAEFMDLYGNENKQLMRSLSLSYGFYLLFSLIGLIWNIIRLYMYFKR